MQVVRQGSEVSLGFSYLSGSILFLGVSVGHNLKMMERPWLDRLCLLARNLQGSVKVLDCLFLHDDEQLIVDLDGPHAATQVLLGARYRVLEVCLCFVVPFLDCPQVKPFFAQILFRFGTLSFKHWVNLKLQLSILFLVRVVHWFVNCAHTLDDVAAQPDRVYALLC